MGGFNYFFAGVNAPTAEQIAALGLMETVLQGERAPANNVSKGPEGRSGWCLPGNGGQVERFFHADRQTWVETGLATAGIESVWIGWENATGKPGPADLRREKQLTGHLVEMGDGREWLIPVARRVTGEPALPQRVRYSVKSRKFEATAIVEAYAALWEASREPYEMMRFLTKQRAEEVEIPMHEACAIALLALNTNYRIGAIEADVLGLFDTESVQVALLALCDFPALVTALREQQKKTGSGEMGGRTAGSDGSSSNSGPAGGTAVTGQAGRMSGAG